MAKYVKIVKPIFKPFGILKNEATSIVPKFFFNTRKDEFDKNLDLHKNKTKQLINVINGFTNPEMAKKFEDILTLDIKHADFDKRINSYSCYSCIKAGFELDWEKIESIIFNSMDKGTEEYTNDLNRLYHEMILSFNYGSIVFTQSYYYELLFYLNQDKATSFIFGNNGNNGHVHLIQHQLDKMIEAQQNGTTFYPIDIEGTIMKNAVIKMVGIKKGLTVDGTDYSKYSNTDKFDLIEKTAVLQANNLSKYFTSDKNLVSEEVKNDYEKTPNFIHDMNEPISME